MLEEAKEVCPTTVHHLLSEGAAFIDVRERSEVAVFSFDVSGVMNIPMSELELRWSEVPRDRPVVSACDTGVRSLKATYFLQFHGYTDVSHLGGGIVKWTVKGFPVKGQRAANSCSTECCGPTKCTTATLCS